MPGHRGPLRDRLVRVTARSGCRDCQTFKRSTCLQALRVGGASAEFSGILAAISAAPPGSVIQIAEGRLVACTRDAQHLLRGLAERLIF